MKVIVALKTNFHLIELSKILTIKSNEALKTKIYLFIKVALNL